MEVRSCSLPPITIPPFPLLFSLACAKHGPAAQYFCVLRLRMKYGVRHSGFAQIAVVPFC
jgi:hypothetical protein